MLKEDEINKIIELIKQGKTDYSIEEETGIAHGTIKKIRENYYMKLGKQTHEDKLNSESTIGNVKRIYDYIELVIKSGELEEKARKEWEKRLESLETLLRCEVNERILNEIIKAVENRDKEWRKHIEDNYVKKEIAVDFENKIENLSNEVKKKDKIIIDNQNVYLQNLSFKQYENDRLKTQNGTHISEKNFLKGENLRFYNYINNRLDNDVRFGQNELNFNIQLLNNQKNDFENYKNKYLTFFNDVLQKMNEKHKDLKIREDKLVKNEEKINIFLELFFKEIDILMKTSKEQSFDEKRLQKSHKQLEDLTNYLNNNLLLNSNSGKQLFLNIETNQKNSKISSENHTHQENNENEKEKPSKITLPSNIEHFKPTITPLDPNNIPPPWDLIRKPNFVQ